MQAGPNTPRIIVYSSLFPSAAAPNAGTFIRERMFRVARRLPLVVVAPQAWSPVDWAIRLFRKGFRPQGATHEVMDGIEVYRPRFLSLPGVLKRLDGWLMGRCTLACVRRVQERFDCTLIDAHFGYPDGYAATWIGRRLGLPVTITLRGSKDQRLLGSDCEPALREALASADRLLSVTASLVEDVGGPLGQPRERFTLVGNGVDLARFGPADRGEARRRLGIPEDATVLIGVGNLIDLKGFHRVIPLLPGLRKRFPKLLYLIVGGATGQGDNSDRLRALAREHGVQDIVRLCGRQPQDELRWYYSAADVFALATAYEGWANVFLEAMSCGLPVITTRVGGNPEVVASPGVGTLVDFWDAQAFGQALSDALDRRWDREAMSCGLPVITTRVGGNPEVVSSPTVGTLVDFWDAAAFGEALSDALDRQWDREAIRAYARANDWERRVDQLVRLFEETCAESAQCRATPERHRLVRNSQPGSQGDAG